MDLIAKVSRPSGREFLLTADRYLLTADHYTTSSPFNPGNSGNGACGSA